MATRDNNWYDLGMAKKTVKISDLSGVEIPEGRGASIRINMDDGRAGSYELDVTAEEARELGMKGRPVSRRGRRPKATA